MATETKFTPGPWKLLEHGDGPEYGVDGKSNHYVTVDDSNDNTVCNVVVMESYVFGKNRHVPFDEHVGNARLIAAAPNMYAVLEKLAAWNRKYPPDIIYHYDDAPRIENELTAIINEGLAALNKANP